MVKRSPDREQFLFDVLTTAIEHQGYGFFDVEEWQWSEDKPAEAYAVISDKEDFADSRERWRLTIDTIAKGIGIIRNAKPNDADTLVTADGKVLGYGGDARRDFLLANSTNGEDGDYDVIGALAAVECALFGQVVYG
jgi:hypothetical protein